MQTPQQPEIVPHRLYKPLDLQRLSGRSATFWRERMELGELPSIPIGRGAIRRHRAVTGAAFIAFLERATNGSAPRAEESRSWGFRG